MVSAESETDSITTTWTVATIGHDHVEQSFAGGSEQVRQVRRKDPEPQVGGVFERFERPMDVPQRF